MSTDEEAKAIWLATPMNEGPGIRASQERHLLRRKILEEIAQMKNLARKYGYEVKKK